MSNNRIQSSIKNSTMALLGQVVVILLNFVGRTFFIKTLGAAYLGINGLFTNILSVLSFAELGFGTAIISAMYAPLAQNDVRKISSLMNYYRRAYEVIGTLVFFIGLLLIPFLSFFIKDVSELPTNLPPLWIIYVLYLLNTSLSFFFNYKRSLIIASQNGYLDSLNQLLFNIIKSLCQIITLIIFKDFLVFLFIQIFCTFFSNYFMSKKADKLFPYLRDYNYLKLESKDRSALKRNVLAMSSNKLGSVVISGVDNLLISKFAGIIVMGIYSNYLLVTTTIRIVFMQVLSPITASVGNFLVEKTIEESLFFFRKLFFINAYIAICLFVSLSTLINPFINLMWGEKYEFSLFITMLICTNFYLDRMRASSQIFIDAKGLFWPIKWKSLFEAIINLIFSLYFLLVLKWGIESILIATIISNISTNIWWEPYVVFKYGLDRKVSTYFVMLLKYTFTLIFAYALTIYLQSFFPISIFGFFIKCILAVILPNLVMFALYSKTSEYKYFINLLRVIINRSK